MKDDEKGKPASVTILTPAAWREGPHREGKRPAQVQVGLTFAELEFLHTLDGRPARHVGLAVGEYVNDGKTDPPHFDQACTDINLNLPVVPLAWHFFLARGGTVVDHLTVAILDYLRKKGFKGERPC
jgi:hypothetical protein